MLIYRGSFSVFSTSVEVILSSWRARETRQSILHVCGGDPTVNGDDWYPVSVFSTSVEVILLWAVSTPQPFSILHTCGGDPSRYISQKM